MLPQARLQDGPAAADEGSGGLPPSPVAALEEHRVKQVRKLEAAAARAGVALGAGWTVEARMRQNGETRGAHVTPLSQPLRQSCPSISSVMCRQACACIMSGVLGSGSIIRGLLGDSPP